MRNDCGDAFPERSKVLILVGRVNSLIGRKFLILLWEQKRSAFRAVRKRSDGGEQIATICSVHLFLCGQVRWRYSPIRTFLTAT